MVQYPLNIYVYVHEKADEIKTTQRDTRVKELIVSWKRVNVECINSAFVELKADEENI